MAQGFIGEFEQMVMLTVLQLGDEAYGIRIMEEMEARVSRTVSRGAMYITLDRLEAKGLLRSRVADPTPERGGRGKRFVSVSEEGVQALAQSRQALQELWRGIEPVLDEGQ